VFELSKRLPITDQAFTGWLAPCRFKSAPGVSAENVPESGLFVKISAPKAALLQNAKAGKVLGDRRWIAEPP
jgi:hypothetical protein